MTAERAQQIGEQALQETRQLQEMQQAMTNELQRSVQDIGITNPGNKWTRRLCKRRL